MTPDDLRQARRLLGWSAAKLAAETNTHPTAISVFERTGHMASSVFGESGSERLAAIRTALETAGVEFIDQNGDDPGVRMRKL